MSYPTPMDICEEEDREANHMDYYPSRSAGLYPRGRKPKFFPSDVLTMAILLDNGWSITRIAEEFRTVRSVVARYLHHEFGPKRWAE